MLSYGLKRLHEDGPHVLQTRHQVHLGLHALYLELDLVQPGVDADRYVDQVGQLGQDGDVGLRSRTSRVILSTSNSGTSSTTSGSWPSGSWPLDGDLPVREKIAQAVAPAASTPRPNHPKPGATRKMVPGPPPGALPAVP